jgi:AraC-like DNA-binding protein
MDRPHTHPDVEVNCMVAGSIRYFMAGRFHELRAGEIGIFWAGMPHQSLEKSADADGVWVCLPLLWLLRSRHTSRLVDELFKGRLVRYGAPPSSREQFAHWLRDFRNGDEALRDVVAREIEAHLMRISLALQPDAGGDWRAFGPYRRIGEITAYLARNYNHDISVDSVAASVGLHPKYLLTLFRQTCHMTLWEYITRLRLAHAQRLLLTTERTILDIALEAGFASSSAFYNAFKKYVPSATPSQFRSRGR